MGNSNEFTMSKFTFIEQLKIDTKSEQKILGVYINPTEFPTSGLITVSNKSIHNYSPVNGKLFCIGNIYTNILFCDYNRKSKEGSVLAIVTEDMKLLLLVTDSLTIIRSVMFSYSKMKILENSSITSLNFQLGDTVFLGFSDGSVIKSKYNEEAFNLIYEHVGMKNITSDEEEFENIKSVYSTDNIDGTIENGFKRDTTITTKLNPIEFLIVSKKYKILFAIQKYAVGKHKVKIFCLRTNRFMKTFCKIEGKVNEAKLVNDKDILSFVVFNIDTKQTTLELWHFSDNTCPTAIYNMSSLLNYPFTIRSMNLTQVTNKFYIRTTNQGKEDNDIVIFGTSCGDIIIGKICILVSNNKIGFEPLCIYQLKNEINKGDQISTKFEISFVSLDLFFDTLILGDINSNVRIIDKILQIGKKKKNEENLAFFSFFNDKETEQFTKHRIKMKSYEINRDLPLFSVNHDVIKDRSIIMYDQGKDVVITKLNEQEIQNENRIESSNKDKQKL